MSFYRKTLLFCCCVLLGADPLAAAILQGIGSGNTKPASPDYEYNRAVFDCTPGQTQDLFIGFQNSFSGDTSTGTNQISSYPCAPWNESGPENIIQLEVAAGDTIQLQVWFTDPDPELDLDLFLLNACDTDSCLISDNTEFVIDLVGGTYYLIIDGYQGAAGSYSVSVAVRYAGVPPFVCSPSYSTVVDITQPEFNFSGNLWEQYDAVQGSSCSPILLKGGEQWFSVVMPPPADNQFGGKDFSQFTANITQVYENLDIGFWLFNGCGADAVCLAYVNKGTAGQPEQLTYRNESDQEIEVYLGVDCFRPADALGTGFYDIQFISDVVVPTEKTSFGSLRALYR